MARELALTCSCLVRCEHGLTELLPGSIKALEGLVGDLKPTHDLPNFCLVAHLENILLQEYVTPPPPAGGGGDGRVLRLGSAILGIAKVGDLRS